MAEFMRRGEKRGEFGLGGHLIDRQRERLTTRIGAQRGGNGNGIDFGWSVDCIQKWHADPEDDHQNVKNLIEACNKDLIRYRKHLQKVQPNPKASKAKQALKKLVNVLEEKTLTEIRTEINHHCTVLGAQLSHLQLNPTIACDKNIVELKNASTERKAHDITQSALLQRTTTEISAQPTHIALPKGQPRSADYDSVQNVEDPSEEEGPALAAVIQILSALASEKEGTLHNEEADAVIDDLTVLIPDAVEKHNLQSDLKGKKRKSAHDSDVESIGYRDLKRLRGLLTASRSLEVNKRRESASSQTTAQAMLSNIA
ncbi:MAG: hypothetical protein Q9165_008322 [Trypethelium subeluteriae]